MDSFSVDLAKLNGINRFVEIPLRQLRVDVEKQITAGKLNITLLKGIIVCNLESGAPEDRRIVINELVDKYAEEGMQLLVAPYISKDVTKPTPWRKARKGDACGFVKIDYTLVIKDNKI